MDDLRLAWKNLWRNRRRTIITLVAIAFSITLMQGAHNLAFGVYSRMIDSGVRVGSGHLAVYRGDYVDSRNEKLTYPLNDLTSHADSISGVEAALPRLYLPGLAQSSRESRGIVLTGIEPERERRINPYLKDLTGEKMIRSLDGRDAIIGRRLLEELKIREGGKFVVTIQSQSGDLASELLRVRGVFDTGIKEVDRSLVMVGRERASQMAGVPGQIHELAIIIEPGADERHVFEHMEAAINGQPQLHVVGWEESMANLADAIRLDYASQKFIFVVIVLIVTIGVINTLLMSVMERIPEFGVILALGASPLRLWRMLLCEALLLGAFGMLLGSLCGSLLTWYLVDTGIDLRNFVDGSVEFGGVIFDPIMRAGWDIPWMLQMAVYVFFLSLLAGLYPARKAGRISPARAMRYH